MTRSRAVSTASVATDPTMLISLNGVAAACPRVRVAGLCWRRDRSRNTKPTATGTVGTRTRKNTKRTSLTEFSRASTATPPTPGINPETTDGSLPRLQVMKVRRRAPRSPAPSSEGGPNQVASDHLAPSSSTAFKPLAGGHSRPRVVGRIDRRRLRSRTTDAAASSAAVAPPEAAFVSSWTGASIACGVPGQSCAKPHAA